MRGSWAVVRFRLTNGTLGSRLLDCHDIKWQQPTMWMINLNTGFNHHTSLLSRIHVIPTATSNTRQRRLRIHYPIVTPSLHSSAGITVQRPISHGVVVHGGNAHLIDEAAEAAGDGTDEMIAGESSEMTRGRTLKTTTKFNALTL